MQKYVPSRRKEARFCPCVSGRNHKRLMWLYLMTRGGCDETVSCRSIIQSSLHIPVYQVAAQLMRRGVLAAIFIHCMNKSLLPSTMTSFVVCVSSEWNFRVFTKGKLLWLHNTYQFKQNILCTLRFTTSLATVFMLKKEIIYHIKTCFSI